MDYPKRLIEVDLPIKRISAHARREKSIRHGHISTLHIWWARRPLAACRAVICAALWPDPADEKCPPAFRDEARRLMTDWAKNHLDLTSPESMSRFNRMNNDPKVLADNIELRRALLDFIADFANWDNSTNTAYLSLSQSLTAASHIALGGDRDSRPLVADPFAGGGSIPLEALRVGADAFASDLNPIPVLLNKVVLEYIPKYGETLASAVREWGDTIRKEAANEIRRYYPTAEDGATPIAYLWARTIRCEGPGCGAEVPLLRSLWLAKKGEGSVVLQIDPKPSHKKVDFYLVVKTGRNWRRQDNGDSVSTPRFDGTVKRGSVTCPCCEFTTPVAQVRSQLKLRHGGARDARLIAVRQNRPGTSQREYRLASASDRHAANEAKTFVEADGELAAFIPTETLPVMSGVFNAPLYGHNTWGSLYSPRQMLAVATFARCVSRLGNNPAIPKDILEPLQTCLALSVDRLADFNTSLCVLNAIGGRGVVHTFGRQAIPMVWDFMETNPFNEEGANWDAGISALEDTIRREANAYKPGTTALASACSSPLPDDSAACILTDPPYYNAIPYADLSDFFYVWLVRTLKDRHPSLCRSKSAPKDEEICEMSGWDPIRYAHKDAAWYEARMKEALADARRVVAPSGIATVVFAHKSTAGWEAALNAVIAAGWAVTSSWPIDTERPGRLRAQDSAALASSVHLVCRPRENVDGSLRADDVGDWRAVLAELPRRMHEWMPRLAEEGVVGADAIFACLGPALEIFSRHSRVEKASGDVVTLREYLEQVWAAVSTEALSMIFRDADAAGLESDARFTAIVLWTLGAGASSSPAGNGEAEDTEDDNDDDDAPKGKAAKGGYTLEYDAARKIAQGLGVNLEQIDSVVEVKGDKARLRPVGERAATLFGKAERAEAATTKRGKKATQKKLFDKDAEEGSGKTEAVTLGDGAAATPGVTALDRVHQAMLLFANGRADAMKRFIVEDGVGGDARFWKLAQSLSALYPAGSDEKRWVDGVLARKKSLGF